MSNPNRQHFSTEPDDEKSISDSVPLEPRPPITPDNLRFLFDKQKSEEAAFRQYEDDGEDTEVVGPGKRRKRVARSLKSLFSAKEQAIKPQEAMTTPLPPLENVVPISGRFRSAELPSEESTEAVDKDMMAPDIDEPEFKPDVQETFRVDPDAADSPDHQAAKESTRGAYDNNDESAPEPAAPSGPGDGGGGRYDGPPTLPTPPPSPVPRSPLVENYLPPAAVHEPIKVIPSAAYRRGGGISGPLTAFFAANYLSRRRNRRARKETNKLKSEIRDTQRQQQAEGRRLRSIEDSIRNSSSPSIHQIEAKKPATVPVAEGAPTKVSEILAAAPVNRKIESVKPVAPQEKPVITDAPPQTQHQKIETSKLVPLPEAQKTPRKELDKLKYTQEQQKQSIEDLQQAQAEKPPRPVVLEKDKRVAPPSVPEAKVREPSETKANRSPSAPNQNYGAPNLGVPGVATPFQAAKQPSVVKSNTDATSVIHTPHQPMITDQQQKELYRQSMKAGIITGLAIALLGSIAYFILG